MGVVDSPTIKPYSLLIRYHDKGMMNMMLPQNHPQHGTPLPPPSELKILILSQD